VNRLLFGDNLSWLRDRSIFPDEHVDLVYLDPPFNSNATYNVLFREESGEVSQAQFHAFTDAWHWVDAEKIYREFIQTCPLADAITTMEAFHSTLKTSPMMAYLAMMAPRLVELRRVLKASGSIYLHCDPTASHYLKVLMDAVFGPKSFRNEIIWERTTGRKSERQFGRVHDVILFYSRSDTWTWNPQVTPQDEHNISGHDLLREGGKLYRLSDLSGAGPGPPRRFGDRGDIVPPSGRHWQYDQEGVDRMVAEGHIFYSKGGKPRRKTPVEDLSGRSVRDIWTDIEPINAAAAERLGYPTQKPEALLERIIKASSNEGDTVLDPFCGCGTTIAVAQRLKRQWIGIDITYLAINLIKRRLDSAFGKGVVRFVEQGQPDDLAGARRLAELDRFQFQQWALDLVDALPVKGGEGRGADRGVDGLLFFYETKETRQRILVQVKSGGVKRGDVATLLGDVGNQRAIGGLLITLDPPTSAMKKEAVEAGRYMSALWKKKDYPKIQLLTVEGLLSKTERPDTPPLEDPFSKAPRDTTTEQIELPK